MMESVVLQSKLPTPVFDAGSVRFSRSASDRAGTGRGQGGVVTVKRRYGERFPHCTNTGGCCDSVTDWSECDRCGFCIMEQLRREKLRLTRCEDGLMRLLIEKKPVRTEEGTPCTV